MRVATWNINGLRARQDFVAHWLTERKPDVVGLQELKLTQEQFPSAFFSELGYHAIVHGQKAWNGVAVLSRKEATLRDAGLPGQEDLGARFLSVEISGLVFATVYAPNGKSTSHADFPRKLVWYEALHSHLIAHYDAAEPVILCGDFNICPTALDSWNEKAFAGEIFHTDEERERFARLEDWGLRDLFRAKYPDEAAFSWWDYRGGAFHKKQGLRIDFLLGTGSAAERLQSVEIDREYRKKKDGLTASDHAPVIADLQDLD
ncbi:MAG: exodeoxyribonuclease III [Myxococcales bacterium]|nr:exodeoxyribonuclease III [Myxococcales bacterium]